MKTKFFSEREAGTITRRERIHKFFELVASTEADIFTAEDATDFLAKIFTEVENDAYQHNKFFPRNIVSEKMMFFWELYHWGEIPNLDFQTYYACGDTKFSFFVGETGGIEIHTTVRSKHPVITPFFYRDKTTTEGKVLVRPSTSLQDAWGRPLQNTIEFFTKYNLQREIT